MWVLVLIFFVVRAIRSLRDKNGEQSNVVQQPQRLTEKYATLIAHILAQDTTSEIVKITDHSADIAFQISVAAQVIF
jgi:uncharacterized protein with GYD domain